MIEKSEFRWHFGREHCLAPFIRTIGWSKLHRARKKGLTAHYHAEAFEIHCLIRGRMDVVVENSVFRLRAGDVLVTRPGEVHAGVGEIQQQSEFYWIMLSPSDAPASVGRLLPALAERRSFAVGPRVVKIFEDLLQEHLQPGNNAGVAATALTELLVVELERTTGPDFSALSDLTNRCLAMLREDLGHPNGLTGVAKRLGVTPSLLAKQFREEVGESPAKWYLHERLDAAGQMLAAGESTRRIASKLGYSSPQNFATTFRREMGMTPSEYREYIERSGEEPILPQNAPPND